MTRFTQYVVLYSLLFFITPIQDYGQRSPAPKQTAQSIPVGPDEQFGELFEVVQLKSVFPDSKTFADCVPKFPPATILANYEKARNQTNLNLKAFIIQHFTLPDRSASAYTSKAGQSAEQHINDLWPVLTRPATSRTKPGESSGSLIALPKPYVVPGGRFSEVYYWDSYFTMLGLRASGQTTQIRNMVDNFAYLIRTFGFIPNGNRTYFLSRSQPPFFSLMVNLLSEIQGRRVLTTYLPELQREYDFWMAGKNQLTSHYSANRHVVRLEEDTYLNRYYDEQQTPRPESYREDRQLARSAKNPEALYRHLRAAAESGWDFSSRWLGDGKNLRTIHTTDFIPVDLNALLFNLEQTLANAYRLKGNLSRSKEYEQLAQQRRNAIQRYCWNAKSGFFFDYDFTARKPSSVYSLAGVYPLFVKIATSAQAVTIARKLEQSFLKPGGLTTTLQRSGQQWDAPNGWAPLQWIAIQGLRNYRQLPLANKVKTNWVTENLRVYKAEGKLVEKYNVTSTAAAKGGEYPTQDGFGWTNGVLLKLLREK